MRTTRVLVVLVALTMPFLASAQDTAPQVVAQGGGRIVVSLSRLGDADGDGRADLLRIDTRLGEEDRDPQATATAISGDGLERVLWTHTSPEGYGLGVWQDADGDGVLDVMQSVTALSAAAEGLDLVVAQQYRGGFEGVQDVRILSGRDARELTALQTESGFLSENLFVEELWITGLTTNSTALHAAGPSIVLEAFTSRTRDTYAAGPASLSRTDIDARLRFHSLDGTKREVLLMGDDRLASTPAVADIDGDGVGDFVLLDALARQSMHTSGVQATIYEPSVVAYHSDGTLAWRADFERVDGDVSSPILVGDLDGDGKDDLAFATRTTATVGGSSLYTTHLLSGADGHTLGTTMTPFAIAPRPLGDLEGDGREEMLVSHFSDGVSQTYVSGLDFEPRWSIPYDETLILNADGPGRRMTDLTGDGRPDLAVAREFDGGFSFRTTCNANRCDTAIDFDPFQMKLDAVSVEGQALWTRELSNLLAYGDVLDLDGRGGVDFAVLHLEGDASAIKRGDLRGANVTLEVFAGEDGASLLWHDLRGPGAPLTRDGFPSIALVPLGDLDSRGGSEFAVGLRERSADFDISSKESVIQDWVVFSMSAGGAIAGLQAPKGSDAGDSSGPNGPEGLDVAPGLVPIGGDSGTRGAPMPAPGAMLALAAAIAVVLRRRR